MGDLDIQIPLISRHACKGGARITHEYRTDRLETKLEAEGVEVRRNVNDLVEQMWSAALSVASVSSSQISRTCTDLPSSVPHSRPTELGEHMTHGDRGAGWVLAAFQLVSLIQ